MADKKRLFIDADGTLFPFQKIEIVDMEGLLTVKDYLNRKGYFQSLPVYQNVCEAIKILANEHKDEIELFILTAVYEDAVYAKEDKNASFDMYFPEIDSAHRIFTICGQNKCDFVEGGVSKEDYLLDDFTANLIDWEKQGTGIKMLNGINHTHETWQGNRVCYQSNPKAMADNLYKMVVLGERIQDKLPVEKDVYHVMHSVTVDAEDLFADNPEKSYDIYDNQISAVRDLWTKIIQNPDFKACEFKQGDMTYILSKSTRYGIDYQLSSIDANNIPVGHADLLKETGKNPNDGMYYQGVVDYMQRFHGDMESLLSIHVINQEESFDIEKYSFMSQEERDSMKEHLGTADKTKQMVLVQEYDKMRQMESHLFDLKSQLKGEEFKLFYDCVYMPQNTFVKDFGGIATTHEELVEYRQKVDSPLYLVAEELSLQYSVDMGCELRGSALQEFLESNINDLLRADYDKVQELFLFSIGKRSSLMLELMVEYSVEITATGIDAQTVFNAPNILEALKGAQYNTNAMEFLVADIQRNIQDLQKQKDEFLGRTFGLGNPDIDYGFSTSTPAGVTSALLSNQIERKQNSVLMLNHYIEMELQIERTRILSLEQSVDKANDGVIPSQEEHMVVKPEVVKRLQGATHKEDTRRDTSSKHRDESR